MGYLPFNLIVLQLIAPTANMTKAEYKDAFGIDLDDIDIKAVRLIVSGNEKYAVDQIKEVEDGIEIYFNGHIMSITDIVQVSDEVYDVANAKPIYYHPIRIESSSAGFKITGTILNNSGTAFENFSALLSYIRSLLTEEFTTFDFLVSGGLLDSGDFLVPYILRVTSGSALLYYYKKDGTAGSISVDSTIISSFGDYVNKIN